MPAAAMRSAAAAAWVTALVGAGLAAAPLPETDRAAAAAATAPAAVTDPATVAALADLGLALLRQPGPVNAVVSPLATAAALGLVHAGVNGRAEREIEELLAGATAAGTPPLKQRLPALLHQLQAAGGGTGAPAPLALATRLWLDPLVATAVPPAYAQRIAQRYGADARRLSFADSGTARAEINRWTADHTAGRVTELLPAGSLSPATRLTLTAAVHFRSPWERPFDPAQTAPRPFRTAAGSESRPPTLNDQRSVLQARIGDGTQVLVLPFAGGGYALWLALPAEGSGTAALLQSLRGADFVGWRAALQPQTCQFALPRFEIAPQSAALKPVLEALGLKTAFTAAADLRPLLGRHARGAQLADIHQAAGITIDEQGGEAVAAAAATVRAKSLALPAPPCAVDRAFLFAVVHAASGTPLFMGRIGDPAQAR